MILGDADFDAAAAALAGAKCALTAQACASITRIVVPRARHDKFAEALNNMRVDFGLAFGGLKQSGIGREGGKEGLRPFLELKTVLLDAPPTT